MKICPNCGAKNRDAAMFCEQCGTGITDVPISTDGAKDLFNKAAGFLNDGVKLAKDTVTVGAEKARKAVEAEKEKRQSAAPASTVPSGFVPSEQAVRRQASDSWDDAAQAASPQNTNWDDAANPDDAASVTVKQYPFFRDEEETAIAVIGEKAAVADLEGTYERPYAVLTQKRLYCKNEAGNFVMEVSQIQEIGENPDGVKTWQFIIPSALNILLVIIMFIVAFLAFTERSRIAANITSMLSFGVCGIMMCLSIVYQLRKELIKSANALCIASILLILWAVIISIASIIA